MGILPKPNERRALRLWGMHRITQHADSGNRYLHDVARNERTDAGRSAGGDHIARIERHHPGDPADQKSARIEHERSAAGLTQRAIDVSFDENIRRIESGFDMRADRGRKCRSLCRARIGRQFSECRERSRR